MIKCKLQAQKCHFSKVELEERLTELISGTHEGKVQEVLFGKEERLKLDKAMDIARKGEATVNNMTSLALQSGSAVETNIDAVRQSSNMQCGKCGLHHEKKCLTYEIGAGSAGNTIIGSKCAEISKCKIDNSDHRLNRNLKAKKHKTRQSRARYTQQKT